MLTRWQFLSRTSTYPLPVQPFRGVSRTFWAIKCRFPRPISDPIEGAALIRATLFTSFETAFCGSLAATVEINRVIRHRVLKKTQFLVEKPPKLLNSPDFQWINDPNLNPIRRKIEWREEVKAEIYFRVSFDSWNVPITSAPDLFWWMEPRPDRPPPPKRRPGRDFLQGQMTGRFNSNHNLLFMNYAWDDEYLETWESLKQVKRESL